MLLLNKHAHTHASVRAQAHVYTHMFMQVTGDKADAKAQIKALYDMFVKADCTMVEVSKYMCLRNMF